MKTIWKYQFEIVPVFGITVPKGAVVLSAQMQGDVPCLWALVDTRRELVARRFYLFGTGNNLPEETTAYSHLDTFQQGPFVWHLFEDLLSD